jgi:DNA-binding NarL/FixJ family response regulator
VISNLKAEWVAAMSRANGSKLGDMASMVKLVEKLPVNGVDQAQQKRRLVAELCKVVGAQVSGSVRAEAVGLSPRMQQTLEALIAGDSEKQIALKLQLSQHTIHVYVKQLYKRFGANSRGELLARFVRVGK